MIDDEGFLNFNRIKPFAWQKKNGSNTWSNQKIYTAIFILIWISSLVFAYGAGTAWGPTRLATALSSTSSKDRGSKIAKVAMLWGDNNPPYERAIASHQRHADRWGEDFHISRYNGTCGYWNKLIYLLSLFAQEFARPDPSLRTEWLMFVDADTIVLNENIPSSIFLPPAGPQFEHIHFIAGRDQNGLNIGVFLMRVNPWSMKLLVESLAYRLCNNDIDLGRNAEQLAMALTFNKTSAGPMGTNFKDHVAYVPRWWFNTYDVYHEGEEPLDFFGKDAKVNHTFQGERGDFIVHFPGRQDEEKAVFMTDWEDFIEGRDNGTWAMPLEETRYPREIGAFWDRYKKAVDVMRAGEKAEGKHAGSAWGLVKAVDRLRISLAEEADNEEVMDMRVDDVEKELKAVKKGGRL